MFWRTIILISTTIMLLLPQPAEAAGIDDIRVSMELDQVPVSTVITLIARQNGLNIVASGEVEGGVSIILDDVPLPTALKAILTPLGLNYIIRDDVIIVKQSKARMPGEYQSKIFHLKYLDATTALTALTQVKSEQGQISILGGSEGVQVSEETPVPNQIIATDRPEYIEAMQSLLNRLDIARRLISIDVKIVETTIDTKSQLGFSWPTAAGATMGGDVSEGDESDAGTGVSNLTGTYDPNNGNWNWGTLSVDQARLFLDFLKQNGNSRLLSDPHVTVIENHPAVIKAETIIPIPTVNRFSEGGATQDIMTFQDEEIGISLRVTPRINEGNRITLDVFPQVEHITGFSGPPDNQKPITASRSIKTTIIVNDGETVALGGMLEETEIIQTQKVPLLGSIPLIGKLLFTHHSKEISTTDLIILITPRIIQ